jgi:thiol-disulfide isomerase/thioredoxin
VTKTRSVLLGLIVLLLAAGGVYFARRDDGKTARSAESGGMRKAPDFEVAGANGKSFSLEGWKDHAIVVHFWASWCAPCIPEIPEILGAAKRLPKDRDGRAIHWLLVSQDTTWEKARTILKDEGLPENVFAGLDPEAKVSDSFGSYQFPETYLITRKGEIAAKWIGPQEWSGTWGEQALAGIESVSRTEMLPTPSGGR